MQHMFIRRRNLTFTMCNFRYEIEESGPRKIVECANFMSSEILKNSYLKRAVFTYEATFDCNHQVDQPSCQVSGVEQPHASSEYILDIPKAIVWCRAGTSNFSQKTLLKEKFISTCYNGLLQHRLKVSKAIMKLNYLFNRTCPPPPSTSCQQ